MAPDNAPGEPAELKELKELSQQSARDTDIIPLEALNYLHPPPQLTASLKRECADFCVDEELGFSLSGEGEHLWLQIRKTDLATSEVARRLSEACHRPPTAIGYSGMKDRRAECTQWFSVQLPAQEEHTLAGIEDTSLQILDSHRNSRKLGTGSHKCNRFKIRLRDCSGPQAEFNTRLRALIQTGVPNYFGAQRFGRQLSNLTQFLELIGLPVATGNSGPRRRLGRLKRSMLLSAARAYLFNQLLSSRLGANSWNRYLAGDVLNLDGTSRCFVLQADDEWDQSLQQRLQTFDIHITGALAGVVDPKDKYVSRRQAADIEDAVFAQFETILAGLQGYGLTAARRPLRFLPAGLEWEWAGENELLLSFSLPRGTYATSFLRELCDT